MSNYYTSSTVNTPSGPPRPYPFAHGDHSAGSTPASRSPSIPFQTSNVRGAGSSHSPAFTPAMRDRQARGKDAYAGSASDEYDDDDYDYDDVDMQDYDTPQRPPTGTLANTPTPGGGRLFSRPQPARHVSRANRNNGSDSSDFDFDEYDTHGHDFVGGISAMTRFSPAGRASGTVISQDPGFGAGAGRQRGESFESWRRREHARDILEQPELLMWYAASREDSIPGTRLYYTRILCGLEEDEVQQSRAKPRKSGNSMPVARV